MNLIVTNNVGPPYVGRHHHYRPRYWYNLIENEVIESWFIGVINIYQ